MNILAPQVGIDVSLESLDTSIEGAKPIRYQNDGEGCELLAAKLPKGAVVHLESTGGYERLIRRTLQAKGFVVKVHNPLRVRRSAQADGVNAKTDSIDAKHLANKGSSIKAERVKSEELEGLCDLSRAIDQLKRKAGQLKVMAKKPQGDPFAMRELLEQAKEILVRVDRMQREFERRVKSTELGERFGLAKTVPGVGPCLARVVTSELPRQLDEYTEAKLCAYSSTVPMDDSSGKRKNKPARIKAANMHLKAALYMPAVACIRRQAWAKDLYARLLARGRCHRQAIIAVMRRLFLRIVQVLKRGFAWQEKPLRT